MNRYVEKAIREVAKTDKPEGFTIMNQTAVLISQNVIKQMADLIKQYINHSGIRYEECLDEDDTVDGYDRSDEFYWEGYYDCAQDLLNEIKED